MLISIITASYNYEDYIKETIQSVINQTYKDWELIIVDDGSSDNSIEVIKSYCKKDNRIKLYQHEGGVNKGLTETLKLGIKKANGDWIAFLESDDKFAPNCLEEKVKVIEKNPKVKFIFSDYEMFGNQDEIKQMQDYYKHNKKMLCARPFRNQTRYFIKYNCIATFSIVMLKKELLENLDWNTPCKPWLDYYLWTQIGINNKLYYIDEKLTYWRMHKQSYIHITNKNSEIISEKFRSKVKQLCSKNFRFTIYNIPRTIKNYRRGLISIKFGKNAKFILFGKAIIGSSDF